MREDSVGWGLVQEGEREGSSVPSEVVPCGRVVGDEGELCFGVAGRDEISYWYCF